MLRKQPKTTRVNCALHLIHMYLLFDYYSLILTFERSKVRRVHVALENRESHKISSVVMHKQYSIMLRKAVTRTDSVEWLNSFTRKASNHQRGYESQKIR